MSRKLKPLNLKDVLITGSAVDGYVDIRLIDGDKIASKRFCLPEAIKIQHWLSAFVRQHRYQNSIPTNIEVIPEIKDDRD